MGIDSVFPQIAFRIGDIGIKNTVVQTWIVMAVMLGLAALVVRRYRVWEPRTWQLAVETIVDYVHNLILDTGGREIPGLLPYLTTMIVFIVVANLLGLVPALSAPTRDLNTTVALSFISLISCQVFSIRYRGVVGWLRSFVEPNVALLPLNLLGLVSRVMSMSLRLFGNVVAGEIIGAVMFALVPALLPLPLTLLGSITGVLQALVFTVLTLVFILDAIGEEEEQVVEP